MDAGLIMRKYHHVSGVPYSLKPDKTRVTAADKKIGEYVARQFREYYPSGVCIREETDFPLRTGGGFEGVFDEIDGTLEFSRGGLYAVFAGAVMLDHQVWNSIIYAPLLDEQPTYEAVVGLGAFCNNRPIHVSKKKAHPKIEVTTAGVTNELYKASAVISELGLCGCDVSDVLSISFSCALLAEGKTEGVLFPWTTLHDIVPGSLLVKEAGGIITDLNGRDLDLSQNAVEGFIAANCKDTHDMLLNVAQRNRQRT